MKLGEFFIDLFVDSANGELTVGNLVTKMGELEATTLGALGILAEFAKHLAAMTDASINASLSLQDMNTLTGVNTQELQKWIRVAEHLNVPVENVLSTFKNLSSALAQFKTTGDGPLLALVRFFHIIPSKNSLKTVQDILEAIRKSKTYQGLPEDQKTLLLGKIGIAPLMARELNLTANQFDTIGNKLEGISAAGQQNFIEMASILSDIMADIKQVGTYISELDAAPILAALREGRELMDAIVEAFKYLQKGTATIEMLVNPKEGIKHIFGDILKSVLLGGGSLESSKILSALDRIYNPVSPLSDMSRAAESYGVMTAHSISIGDTNITVSGHPGKTFLENLKQDIIPLVFDSHKKAIDEWVKGAPRSGIGGGGA